MRQKSPSPKKKWKKWRREEEEGFCTNLKPDEAAVFNCGILINDKAAVEDNDFFLKNFCKAAVQDSDIC